jgi:GH24 family phage-related lysozyme (muramidase)
MSAWAIAWDFVEELEGWRLRGYVPPDDGGPVEAGVTIGPGVDLGWWSVDQLRRRGVPADLVDKLSPYCGVRGDQARLIAGGLVLSGLEVDQLARPIRRAIVEAVAARFDRAAGAAGFMAFAALPTELQTVVASVAFQYGPALSAKCPKFWRLVTTGAVKGAVAELRDFGDAFRTRRRREADYLAAILPR